MTEETIKAYLDKQPFIRLEVHQEELEDAGKGARYGALLDYLGRHPEYAAKFCSKLSLSFAPDCGDNVWKNEKAAAFVQRLLQFPWLFFFAEKEGETLKLLVALGCQKGKDRGDQLALDKEVFQAVLQKQMQGMVRMSQKAGFSAENIESLMLCVFEYFGIEE